MSGTRRASTSKSIGEHLLRLMLLGLVIVFGAMMFAAALLPPVGAAGRAVQEFADEFNQIGTDVDLHFPRIPERSTIYAADGSILATLFLDENRKIVRLNQVPDLARDAVIAIEDDEFYEHPGLDFQGIIRALLANVRAGTIQQGASTITQQLARNVFSVIGTEDTLARKIQEARVAMRLEERYTKDEILELYLNEVYFGRGVYGIGTASEYYFGKKPGKLALPEAAMLAGLISAPETYSPVNDPDAAMGRRNVVIDRMAELGMVGLEEATAAKTTEVKLDITEVGNEDARFPFFVEYLKAQILDDPRFGPTRKARIKTLFQGGLKIYTTLDPSLQRAGEAIVRNHLPAPSDPEGAVASVDVKTGAVKALVASTEFEDSQVNLATGQGGTGRQSGSAFKPFTLVAALEQGIPVGKVYKASSGQYVDCGAYGGEYQVFNAGDGGGTGYVDLRTATAGSINAVFVQLAVDAGVPNVVDAAHRMGIVSPLPPFCSVTLGTAEVTPLEMASAFTTLAHGGVHCLPFAMTRVETRTGKQILSQKRGTCEEVVDPEVANDVAGLLGLVVDQGTGTAAALGNWDVFGKTGTTNDSADVWFSGCTRQICSATWVGHPEARVPMPGAYGGTVAAPIWHDFMLRAMQGLPSLPLPAAPVPEQAQVPNVVGATQKDAIETLVDANFTPIVTMVPGSEPAGTVVSQSPGGGATVTAGGRVTISVSNGEIAETTVPNVVGLDRTTAADALRQAGFRVTVDISSTDQSQFDGIVIAQTPDPGTSLFEGASVTIAVGDYKKPKPPPAGTPPTEAPPGT